MGDLSNFDSGILLHISSDHELTRVEAWVDGSKIIAHTVRPSETAVTALNALASSLSRAAIDATAVKGAMVWQPKITKQEAGQLRRLGSFFWSIVRAFLP
jgi:hypothetical protein